jgi:general secretion pathway protein D
VRSLPATLAVLTVTLCGTPLVASPAQQNEPSISARSDSVSVRLVDVELRTAVQALGRFLLRPLVIGNLPEGRVSLETPEPVPRTGVERLLRGILEAHNVELVIDSTASLYALRARNPHQGSDGVVPQGWSGRADPGSEVQLFVVRLRHARAADVAATVNALYGKASALGEPGAPGVGPAMPAARPPGNRTTGVAPAGIMAADGTPRATQLPVRAVPSTSGSLSGDVTIIPDQGTNALLVRASRTDFQLIQAAVTELDARPLQVVIEVVIAEVRKDRGFSFGTDSKWPTTTLRGTPIKASGGTSTGLGLGDFVLRIMNIGRVDAEAALLAGAQRGDVTIVSRPVVVASNNEVAEINVGSQRPYVEIQRSLPTDVPQRDQIVQYMDVGTKLTVRPTISADGYVQMHVTQHVNAATSETAFDAPVISTRSVSTHLVLKDGQTIVLGGVTDQQKEFVTGGIPFASRLPIVGGLFGRQTRRATETELFLFLTPTVLYDDDDTERTGEPLRRRLQSLKPKVRGEP